MTRSFSTLVAAALIAGAASAPAFAEGGGPGGKGDASSGTLGTQQLSGANATSDYVTSNPDHRPTNSELNGGLAERPAGAAPSAPDAAAQEPAVTGSAGAPAPR